jgi:hypothetical protein
MRARLDGLDEEQELRPAPGGGRVSLVVPVELPDELLTTLEERLRSIVRKELDAHTKGVSPWLNVTRAAEYAVMSEDAIRSATKRGQLKSYRSETGRVRYRREDVDAFLRGEAV